LNTGVVEARDGVIVCSRTETEICQNGMFQVVTFREGKNARKGARAVAIFA
jgi:hypothetical protein